MANNRLYLIDGRTGDKLFIGKGFAQWSLRVDTTLLASFLENHDFEGAQGAKSDLILKTEADADCPANNTPDWKPEKQPEVEQQPASPIPPKSPMVDVLSMTPEQFAAWKHERGFDQVPEPTQPEPPNGEYCNHPQPCGCAVIAHAHDESGTYVNQEGVLQQLNEGGFNGTAIDIRELVTWLRAHRPDLLI
jgi:hypothetical protein